MLVDSIQLSRELIAFNTINPPGQKLGCINHRKMEKLRPETILRTAKDDERDLISLQRLALLELTPIIAWIYFD